MRFKRQVETEPQEPKRRRRRVREEEENGAPDPIAAEIQEKLAKRDAEIAKYRFIHVYSKGSDEERSLREFLVKNNIQCERVRTPAENYYYRIPVSVIDDFEYFSQFQFCPSNGWFGIIPSVASKKKDWCFQIKISKRPSLYFMWESFEWEVVCDGAMKQEVKKAKLPPRVRRRRDGS